MNKKIVASLLLMLIVGLAIGYVSAYVLYQGIGQNLKIQRMEINTSLGAHEVWSLTNDTYDYSQIVLYFNTWGPLANTGFSVYPGVINVTVSRHGIFAENFTENFIVSQETRETTTIWKKYGTFTDGQVIVQIENPLNGLTSFIYRLYLLA
jgi:hypothetical protein